MVGDHSENTSPFGGDVSHIVRLGAGGRGETASAT